MTNCYQIQQSILTTFHSNTKLNKQWSRLILSSYSNQTRINTYDFLAVSNNPDHSWYQWAHSYLWDMPMASLFKGIVSRNQRPGLSAIVLSWVSECLFYLDAFGSPDVDCWSFPRKKDIYTYTLCPMCYGYIGSPKAGVYICSHEGAKRPREGWYILPLLVTQCFHSNEGRAVYGLYTRCLNILPRSITLRMFDHVHKLIDQQQPLVNWPFQCSTTVNQLC